MWSAAAAARGLSYEHCERGEIPIVIYKNMALRPFFWWAGATIFICRHAERVRAPEGAESVVISLHGPASYSNATVYSESLPPRSRHTEGSSYYERCELLRRLVITIK
jgi:hypothetical protein